MEPRLIHTLLPFCFCWALLEQALIDHHYSKMLCTRDKKSILFLCHMVYKATIQLRNSNILLPQRHNQCLLQGWKIIVAAFSTYRVTIKEWYNVWLNCDPIFESLGLFEPTGGSPDVVHLIKYASQVSGWLLTAQMGLEKKESCF